MKPLTISPSSSTHLSPSLSVKRTPPPRPPPQPLVRNLPPPSIGVAARPLPEPPDPPDPPDLFAMSLLLAFILDLIITLILSALFSSPFVGIVFSQSPKIILPLYQSPPMFNELLVSGPLSPGPVGLQIRGISGLLRFTPCTNFVRLKFGARGTPSSIVGGAFEREVIRWDLWFAVGDEIWLWRWLFWPSTELLILCRDAFLIYVAAPFQDCATSAVWSPSMSKVLEFPFFPPIPTWWW